MYLSLGTRVTALHYCCPAVTGNETLQSNTNNTTPSAHQQRALLARRWQITFVDVNCGLWMCCKHQSLVLNVLWLDSVFTDWAVGWGLCLQKSLSPDQQTCQWRRWLDLHLRRLLGNMADVKCCFSPQTMSVCACCLCRLLWAKKTPTHFLLCPSA